MRFVFFSSLLFFLLNTLLLAPSHAQSRSMGPERLAAQANVIAVGRVDNIESEWTADKKAIQTKVTIAVDEYLKGSGDGATMTVIVPGGEVGTVGEVYTHMPVFKKDEDVVVFAERDRQNRLRVSGGTNGKFSIKKSEDTGRSLVAGKESKEMFLARIKSSLSGPASRP